MDRLELALILAWLLRFFCLVYYFPSIKQLIWFSTKVSLVYLVWLNMPYLTVILLVGSGLLLVRDLFLLVFPTNIRVYGYKNSYGPGYDLTFDIHEVKFARLGIRKITGMPGMSFGGSMSENDITFYVPSNVTKFQIARLHTGTEDVFILTTSVPCYLINRQVTAWRADVPYPLNEIKTY